MSKRERERLRRQNRLEELTAKYGPLEQAPRPEVAIDPSWGPVGSLLAQDPLAYEHVLRLHRDILRTLGVVEAPAEPVAPPQAPKAPAPRPTRARPVRPSRALPATPVDDDA